MVHPPKYKFLYRLVQQWPQRAKAVGLNNTKLCKLAGLHRVHFSRIVNGRVGNPRMSTIERVEAVLHQYEKEKDNG